jgi:RluA family pseudouridine synthase
MDIEPIYLDNHLLIVNKPAGLLIQKNRFGDLSILDICRDYIKAKYQKPGKVFLGMVHRLDRPVSGVVVFARTSKAARRVSEQIRQHQVQKIYLAIVSGKTPVEVQLHDYLKRTDKSSIITTNQNDQKAVLEFKRIAYQKEYSLLKIDLHTGRHHQIRAQLSNQGFPILGDRRYGSIKSFLNRNIALHAFSISLMHPTRNQPMTFSAVPEADWSQYFDFSRLTL